LTVRAVLLLSIWTAAAFAQLDSGTITIAASRTSVAPMENAAVRVQVILPQNATLDDALAILKGAGFTASDLSGAAASLPAASSWLSWSFSKVIATADVSATAAALEAARQKLAAAQNGSSLVYSISNAATQPANCDYAALISDALSQGRKVAEAAGASLGSIVSLTAAPQTIVAPYTIVRSGDFTFTPGLPAPGDSSTAVASLPVVAPVPVPSASCSLTVQFRLLQ
jgi:hypothetical protein